MTTHSFIGVVVIVTGVLTVLAGVFAINAALIMLLFNAVSAIWAGPVMSYSTACLITLLLWLLSILGKGIT